MSNRLTFSLASLILIFVLAAIPALAHEGDATHNATTGDHVSVKSITIVGDSDLGNASNDKLVVQVEYLPNETTDPAGVSHMVNDPAALDGASFSSLLLVIMEGKTSGVGTDVQLRQIGQQDITPSTPAGAGKVYLITVERIPDDISTTDNDESGDDGKYEILPAAAAISPDTVKATFTADNTGPTIETVDFEPITGAAPGDGVYTSAFSVVLTIVDTEARGTGNTARTVTGSGVDSSTIALTATPANVTFGSPVLIRTDTYRVTATPVPVAADDTAAISIAVTVNVEDMFDNAAEAKTASVQLKRLGEAAVSEVALTTPIANKTYTAGTAITAVELPAADTDTGTAPLTYSLLDGTTPVTTTAPSNGLSFDPATRMLSGTPTQWMLAKTYTYKVTDAATPPTEAEQKFTITVRPNTPPVLTIFSGEVWSGGKPTGNIGFEFCFDAATSTAQGDSFTLNDVRFTNATYTQTAFDKVPVPSGTNYVECYMVEVTPTDPEKDITVVLETESVKGDFSGLYVVPPKLYVHPGLTSPPVLTATLIDYKTDSKGEEIPDAEYYKWKHPTYPTTVELAFDEALKAFTGTAPTGTIESTDKKVRLTHASDPSNDMYAVSAITEHATKANTYVVTITPDVSKLLMPINETDVTLTVDVMDIAGTSIDSTKNTVSVNIAKRGTSSELQLPTASSSSKRIQLPPVMIQPGGFVVLVRSFNGSGTYDPTTWDRVAVDMPDLSWFFGGDGGINSGTISLHGVDPTTQKRYTHTHPNDTKVYTDTVLISEVMWGRDSRLSVPNDSQWIELYNRTNKAIDLSCFQIQFHRSLVHESTWQDASLLTKDAEPDIVDYMSNAGVTDRLPVHKYHEPWTPKGKGGRSTFTDATQIYQYADPLALISMYRTINYTNYPYQVVPAGAAAGNWSASVYPTANVSATRIATPGAETILRIKYAETAISQKLLINEIGNSSTDAYDWIEIHNSSSGDVNIKDWRFTTVWDDRASGAKAPVGKEEILFTFPDMSIPAGHYVVFAASDPKDTGNDLAAGIDIAKSDADQPNKGLGSKEGIGHQANNTTAFYKILRSVKLPNDGKSRLYILRRSDKIGANPDAQGNVEDVIGSLAIPLRNQTPNNWTHGKITETGRTDTDSAAQRRIFDTSMWPLQWFPADPNKKVPHDKRVDGGAAALGKDKVYKRNGKKLPNEENHIQAAGYTGVGYDRHALRNDENGGTPGYANDAVKGEKSNWMDQVTISEIMLPTHETEGTTPAVADRIPRATKLPQWIEIYNASLTEGVNLKDWYLEIRNTDSEDLITRDLHGTHRLQNVIIPPNQTVLIVSAAGLNSGNFPEQRLINLFNSSNARQVFSLQYRNDPVLSQVGFYIELRDHKGNVVDQVGNLPVTARRGVEARGAANFETAWPLPALNHPSGPRTSLIRVYNDKTGTPNSGLGKVAGTKTEESLEIGWRRSVDTNFHNVPGLTYYGNQRDFGTPGYRGGGPLPVSLSKFRPERLKNTGEIVIRWITESELNNAGFNILRSETRDGEFTQVNKQLIAGHGTTSERNTYEWKDTSAKPNVVYYYQIQDVSFDGQVNTLRVSRLKGNVTAAGKATTTWGALKALQ